MTQEFSIQSSYHTKSIQFDFRPSIDKNPVIIFLHGFKGFKDWGHFNLIADSFHEKGYNVIKLNFSHNGTSQEAPLDFVDLEAFGQNNFSIELDDLDDVLNYIFSSPTFSDKIDLSTIHIIGHSRGGSTALLKASNDKRIASVITWGSPLDILNRYGTEDNIWKKENVKYILNGRTKQEMPLYYQSIEDVIQNKNQFDIYNILKQTTTPTLIIHSKEDTTVDYREIDLVKPNKYIQIELLETGSHTFDGVHPHNENSLPSATRKAIKLSLLFLKPLTNLFS